MLAARPAARPPNFLFKLGTHSIDMLLSGLRLFDGGSPTYPFVARQRRYTLPFSQSCRIRHQGLTQIRRQLVNHAGRDSFTSHGINISRNKLLHCKRCGIFIYYHIVNENWAFFLISPRLLVEKRRFSGRINKALWKQVGNRYRCRMRFQLSIPANQD